MAVVIFGGYGTFGSIIARALLHDGTPVVIAGRNQKRGNALVQELGALASFIQANVRELDSCVRALKGQRIAIHCAGPYEPNRDAVLQACIKTGCHYLDISESREYATWLREQDDQCKEKGLAVIYGCSSFPGISGTLALTLKKPHQKIQQALIALFIGNNNRKGVGAGSSFLNQLGTAPRKSRTVAFPEPFGKRRALPFNTPDHDLLAPLLGGANIESYVTLESRVAMVLFTIMSCLPFSFGNRTARFLMLFQFLTQGLGTSGGTVQVEATYDDGSESFASIFANTDAQPMAALPCIIAARQLVKGASQESGVRPYYELVDPAETLRYFTEAGFEHRTSIE